MLSRIREKKFLYLKKVRGDLAGFQGNPKSIPDGAIVVRKSSTRNGRRHGHVEIKVSPRHAQDSSGKCKANKETCFCSDFCTAYPRSMPSGSGNAIQTVFEWNPEFIEYMSQF